MRLCVLRNLLRTRRSSREVLGGHAARLLTYSRLRLTRGFSGSVKDHGDENDNADKDAGYNLAGTMNAKYKVFHEKDVDVILDVSEEQQKILLEDLNKQEKIHDPYADIDLNRKGESDLLTRREITIERYKLLKSDI